MNNDSLTYNWRNCLTQMEKHISVEDFAKWMKPIEVSSFDGGTLCLSVPSEEWARQMETNFMSSLRPLLKTEFEGIKSLKYVRSKSVAVSSVENSQKSSIQANKLGYNPFAPAVQKKMVIDPQLNFDYDFKNFVAGGCNSLARITALAVAEKPGEAAFNPFFIYGDSGMGKTHLAQAIGVEIKKNNPETNVLYISMNKFVDQYTLATRKGSDNVAAFVGFFQHIDVLIIDDIHELSGKPGTQRALFTIFSHLHITGKQLIFTCDKSPSELKDIEDRIITRFKWGITVPLTKPDYQTKVKIIENKAQRVRLNLTSDIIEYIAANIDGSIREIEGVISSFVAHTTLLNREPSLELAAEILKINCGVKVSQSSSSIGVSSAAGMCRSEVTMDKIFCAVCSYYNISKEDFFSKKKTREVALARQLAMYLAKEQTNLSLKAIGKAIGGKSHATVLYAHKTISNYIETSKEFSIEVEQVKAGI